MCVYSVCQECIILCPVCMYIVLLQCPTAECRGRTFTPLRSSSLTQTIDWQTIRVQDISGDDRREAGRIPRTIECELTADLVDSCVPGDMVTITAVVKATGSEEGELHDHVYTASSLAPRLSPLTGLYMYMHVIVYTKIIKPLERERAWEALIMYADSVSSFVHKLLILCI